MLPVLKANQLVGWKGGRNWQAITYGETSFLLFPFPLMVLICHFTEGKALRLCRAWWLVNSCDLNLLSEELLIPSNKNWNTEHTGIGLKINNVERGILDLCQEACLQMRIKENTTSLGSRWYFYEVTVLWKRIWQLCCLLLADLFVWVLMLRILCLSQRLFRNLLCMSS